MRGHSAESALLQAAREAERAARRHDVASAHALRDALRAAADAGRVPDRAWIAGAIREAADWATDDADVPLLASLGALARAASR
ncbi:MAG TPA: hypothetical protein VK922_11840 [Gemmatimonadaceae bacterium]|nr:hypothetical protein [Gemmatimonadaceae bacterium]